MLRQPRLDAPGALHYVMGRGTERTKIFRSDSDRRDSLDRFTILCRDGRGGYFISWRWGWWDILERRWGYLGVTASAMNRLAASEGLPDLKQYLKVF